jgi:hypothetical protein
VSLQKTPKSSDQRTNQRPKQRGNKRAREKRVEGNKEEDREGDTDGARTRIHKNTTRIKNPRMGRHSKERDTNKQ